MKKLSVRTILIFILLCSITLRVGAAIYLGNTFEGSEQKRVFDQVSYNALAVAILEGRGYSFEKYWYPFTPADTPTAHWSFLYPLYLAGIYGVFGEQPLVARIIQACMSGFLSVLLAYWIGKHLFPGRVGLLSAGLTSVYFYFIFHDAALMTESFFILGTTAVFLLVLKMMFPSEGDRPRSWFSSKSVAFWMLLGGLIGITALLRQTILLWIPFLFLWILLTRSTVELTFSQKIKGLLIVSLSIMMVILPWTVRNYLAYRSFLPLNSNAGYAIYAANHPNHGTSFIQDYVAPLPEELRGQGLNEAQWNLALSKKAFTFIQEDPQRYFMLSLSRFPIFFNFWFSETSSLSSNLSRVFSFGLYLPFFIYGLVLSLKNWRKHSLIYLFVLVFSLLHILTWASIRYRLVVDMLLMPYASFALLDIARRVHIVGWLRNQQRSEHTIPKDRPISVRKEPL